MGKLKKPEAPQQYFVEAIVDSRIDGDRKEYFVKWEGYDSDQNTWEPTEHLTNVLDLIKAFEKSHTKIQTSATKTTSAKTKTTAPKPKIPVTTAKKRKIGNSNSTAPKYRIQSEDVEEILGCLLDNRGETWVLCGYGSDEIEKTPYNMVREHCPKMLLDHWLSRVVFMGDNGDGE